jgi:glucokinase
MRILFDIGGTKMRLSGSKDGRTFGDPVIIQTPKDDFEKGISVFIEAARRIAGDEKIEAVAGGIAGPLDREKTMLLNAPNIPGWNNKPLKRELMGALGTEVYIENDAAVVGLGEALVGAGRGGKIVAYLTVSTGVGGVRIVDGAIDKNSFGFEPGHQILNMDDNSVLCGSCGEGGHLESYISGVAFSKRYNRKAYEVHDQTAWEEAARILAIGLNNAAVFWSPDIIVLGGSMIVGDPSIPFPRIEYHFKNILKIFPEQPVLKKAELGDVGGLHGALAYLESLM